MLLSPFPRLEPRPQAPAAPAAQIAAAPAAGTLRLFFTGFAQDPALLSALLGSAPTGEAGYPDVYVVSHYAEGIAELDTSKAELEARQSITPESLSALESLVASYESIEVVAWSFGVRAALAIMGALEPEILASKRIRAVALAGTISAVDDEHGIAPKVYARMYRALSNPRLALKTMQGFAGQLTADTAIREAFGAYYAQQLKSDETYRELVHELYLLPHLKIESRPFAYERVYLSAMDAIFDAKRAQQSWQAAGLNADAIVCEPSEHLALERMRALLLAPMWH